MKVYEYTNKGSREENQDYVIHGSLPNGSVYIVADGMGGYSDGAIASKVVAESILDYVEANYSQCQPVELLKEAIPFANDALMLKRLAMSAQKMGCVITVLLISNSIAYLTWLGDSRIYMYRGGKPVYQTEDHSVVNELSKIKTLTYSNIEKYSNIVTKSIMGDDKVDTAPIRRVKIQSGDVFLLCTDGVHKEISMDKAYSYDNSHKEEFDAMSDKISDNYSFIKVEI